MDEALDLPSE